MSAVLAAVLTAVALSVPTGGYVTPNQVCADYGDGVPVCDTYAPGPVAAPATDPVAACLISWGWSGIPGDGRVAIYAPSSVIQRAIEECAPRSV